MRLFNKILINLCVNTHSLCRVGAGGIHCTQLVPDILRSIAPFMRTTERKKNVLNATSVTQSNVNNKANVGIL